MALGEMTLTFLHTPGHTPGGLCVLINNESLLTGDTLFIGNCGRTDLEGGDFEAMYQTLQRIKKLPDHIIIYPGHNYGDKPFDWLGNQKTTNPCLIAENLDEFSKIP